MVNVKNQLKKGLVWTALEKYSGQIIGICISMVLARLLTPHDYGVVATASVLLGFLSICTSVGIGPAIIQRKDLSQGDIDNIFTFSIFLGLVMGGISFASSWFIADFYDNEQLLPVIQILSIGLFLGTINMVPSALMSKNMRFKEKATRTLVFQVVFGIVGMVSAFYGAGVYALICPQIIASICTFFYFNYYYPVHISWHFSLEPVKRIFAFSSYIFLSEFINYFSRNLDKLIIGKMISADALGYYEKSYRLMQMPLHNVSSVIYPVLQPVMSNLQNNMKEMAEKYTKIVEVIAMFSFPAAVVLYNIAEDLILVLYGDVWIPAVPPFKVLALSIPLMLVCNPNGAIFLSCNASKQMLYVTSINTAMTVCGFIMAAIVGGTIEAIAWGWSGVILFGTLNSYYQLYVKVMGQSLLPVLKVMVKPLFSAFLLITLFAVYDKFVPNNLLHIVHLFTKTIAGGISLLLYFKLTGQLDNLKSVVSNRKL